MPSIQKQKPTVSKPTNGGSVLSRIKPVGFKGGMKFCGYGRGKTGKTRTACTFPKDALIIGTEDGTQSVADVKHLDFARIYTKQDFDDIIELLNKGKYKTAILDTAGGFQDLILKEILGLDELPDQREWGMAQRDDWMATGAQLKERLHKLLDLADTHEMNIFIIAHERSFNTDEDNNAGGLIKPSVGPALTETSKNWLNGACDYIGQFFIREQTKTTIVKVGEESIPTETPTGKCEYCLRIGAHAVYDTGFRVPSGFVLPDVIVNPTYDKINKIIRGGK